MCGQPWGGVQSFQYPGPEHCTHLWDECGQLLTAIGQSRYARLCHQLTPRDINTGQLKRHFHGIHIIRCQFLHLDSHGQWLWESCQWGWNRMRCWECEAWHSWRPGCARSCRTTCCRWTGSVSQCCSSRWRSCRGQSHQHSADKGHEGPNKHSLIQFYKVFLSAIVLHLTTLEAEALEEASTSLCEVLYHSSLNVNLELKQVNFLPVRAIQSQHIPRFAHLENRKIFIKNHKKRCHHTWALLQRLMMSR